MSDEPAAWLQELPESLRDAPFIGKADSLEDAVGKLAHAAQLVGTSIRIPANDADDDTKNAFYAKVMEVDGITRVPAHDDVEGINKLLIKLGKPEKHEEYKLPALDDFEWDDTIGNSIREYAFEAGMTASQFGKFATKIAEQERDANSASASDMVEQRKKVKDDWGDALIEREDLIRGWMDKSDAPEALRTLLNDGQLPLDTMKWFLDIASVFKGDVTPISKEKGTSDPIMVPSEAREQIPVVLKDLTNMRNTDPRYKDLQEKLVELHRLANPEKAA